MYRGISSTCRAFVRPASSIGLVALRHDALRRRLRPPFTLPATFAKLSTTTENPSIPTLNTTVVDRSESKPEEVLDEGVQAAREKKDARKEARRGPNFKRNQFYRNAFKEATPEEIEERLASPFVLQARTYPSELATRQSAKDAEVSASTQVGHDKIWTHHKNPAHYLVSEGGFRWKDILELLFGFSKKNKPNDRRALSAMRIVLPGNWDLEISNRTIEFIDEIKGLKERLRIYSDHRNKSAIVVRGTKKTLAKAADELLRHHAGVQVFQLGQVHSCDYESKQLWPRLGDGDDVVNDDKADSIWVHREDQAERYWIDHKYEDIPKPEEWSEEAFTSYIVKLTHGRIPSHLASPLYGARANPDKIRNKLIMNAFSDPKARPYITAPTLKMALSFLAHRAGYRAYADRLFTKAESWGIPMDTETFNIMLEGYVSKKDGRYFFLFLRKLKARFLLADARTWLLFLQLVEKDFEKRQIIAAMYDLKMFEDPGLARGMAECMASQDAYYWFKSGRDVDSFMKKQATRYGDGWVSRRAANQVLTEWFRVHGEEANDPAQWSMLVDKFMPDGAYIGTDTLNLILKHANDISSWKTALWALEGFERFGAEFDDLTFRRLLQLIAKTSKPNAFATTLFYGTHHKRLGTSSRILIRRILLATHPNEFWRQSFPPVFTGKMHLYMEQPERKSSNHNDLSPWNITSTVINTIHKFTQRFEPAEPFAKVLSKALALDDAANKQTSKGKPQSLSIVMNRTSGKLSKGFAEKGETQDAQEQKTFTLKFGFNRGTMVDFGAGTKPTQVNTESNEPGLTDESDYQGESKSMAEPALAENAKENVK